MVKISDTYLTKWEVLWIYTRDNLQKTFQAVFNSSKDKQQRKVRLAPAPIFFFFSLSTRV